ncbi:MAG TPA: sugar phosphate isomerase/epimerase, partial [Candidatus Methylacidiphilales bacterium]
PQTIRTAPEKVVERLRKLRCRHTAYPYPADVDWTKWESVDSLVADLDRAGSVLRQAGQVLTYHNHATEFFRLPGTGQTALDYLYAKTSPQNLQAEIDTYWVQHGGGDPVAWCRKLRGRLPLLHLKDYEVTAEQKPNYAAIGQGNLDWPAILAAAGEAGCQWYIVEQDVCPGDPFDSLRTSFDYLAAHTDGH